MLTEIADSNFKEKVRNSTSPPRGCSTFVLIFYSPWCGICKKLLPLIQSISEKYDKARFGKINIITNMLVPSGFQVTTTPTTIIFKDGEEKERIVKEISEQELIQEIEKIL